MTSLDTYDKQHAWMEFSNAVVATRLEGDRALSLDDIASVLFEELGGDTVSVRDSLTRLLGDNG